MLSSSSQREATTPLGPGPKVSPKKVLFLIAEAGYFFSHRFSLARAAQEAGYDVSLATAPSPLVTRLEGTGLRHYPLTFLHRSRLSPLREILALREISTLYQKLRPDIVHHVAMKPVLYGTLAAKYAEVPRIINAFGGLGYLFSSSSLKARCLRFGIRLPMRAALKSSESTLILQNQEDHALLRHKGFLARDNVVLIPGSGVDTTHFSPSLQRGRDPHAPVVISFLGRLLWDKGIEELGKAAALLKKENIHAVVHVYGERDPQNPLSLTPKDIVSLSKIYPLCFKGPSHDVAKTYQASDIGVLPSYREGLPKSLVEAASCGLPLVTTDVPGCRDVIEDGVSGFLVPPKAPEPLAKALASLCQNKALREAMGKAGRQRTQKLFAQERINKQTLALYERV